MSWCSGPTKPSGADKRSFLQQYTAPPWASKLNYIPKYRVKLAQLPTPIQEWHLPGLPEGYQLYIKRDDLTGSTLTGNKVRKLEFLLADAIDRGCTDVIATGSLQSNYCRTTTVAVRQLGLEPHLVMNSKLKDTSELPSTGNMLINLMCGASIYLCDDIKPYGDKIKAKMKQVAEDIGQKPGRLPYTMPRGGSCVEGVYGYIEAFSELLSQGVADNITDIVLACGSAGSAVGLAVANHLACDSKIKIHGFGITSFGQDYTYGHMKEQMSQLGLPDVDVKEMMQFHHQYLGDGYGCASNEQLEFMVDVSRETGIILDPTYTGKSAFGMLCELQKNPTVFKGENILFIHTGGLYGVMDGTLNHIVENLK